MSAFPSAALKAFAPHIHAEADHCPWCDQPIPSDKRDEIESRIAEFRRSSFLVEHRLINAGELAVEGFETRVWAGRDPADPSRLKSQPIPADLMARFPGTPLASR